jgi:hypothetical protein
MAGMISLENFNATDVTMIELIDWCSLGTAAGQQLGLAHHQP